MSNRYTIVVYPGKERGAPPNVESTRMVGMVERKELLTQLECSLCPYTSEPVQTTVVNSNGETRIDRGALLAHQSGTLAHANSEHADYRAVDFRITSGSDVIKTVKIRPNPEVFFDS